jgi:hypothetical protein
MYIFVRLLIAHLLSDIPLNLFAFDKRNGSTSTRLLVLSLHAVIVFLTTLLFLADKLNRTVLFCVLLVAAAHFLIDAFRLKIEKGVYPEPEQKQTRSKKEDLSKLFRFFMDPGAVWSEPGFRVWFILNVFDQCLHLLVLTLVAAYLTRVL